MPHGTPQPNGVPERRNRTLLDMVRSMMSLIGFTTIVLGLCIRDSCIHVKRAPSKSVETTPYELWFSSKPKLSFLKVWSCDAYMKKVST